MHNDGLALYNAAIMYIKDGVLNETNITKGLELLNKSAELETPESLSLFGEFYLNGMYVTKDTKRGLDYIIKAAELNNTYAIALVNS